jgi:hypothetical protein
VLGIAGNPCATHPNSLANVLTLFPRLVELNGEEINDHVKQDMADGLSISRKLIEYLYKNELILMEKDQEIKRLKIKFELFRKLKGRMSARNGPYWEDVMAIQARELRKMEEFPRLPRYQHYKKVRPYMILNLMQATESALHGGMEVRYDHPEFLRIFKWLFCEVLLQLHEFGNNELQVWLQNQTSSFITGSDPESHFQMQLRVFSLLAPNYREEAPSFYKKETRNQHSDLFPDLRMSAAVRKATIFDHLKPIDPRDVLEVNFWNRKDLSVFPIFGNNSDFLRAVLTVIETQLKCIEKLDLDKIEFLRADVSLIGIPSLCDNRSETASSKSSTVTKELSFADTWKGSKKSLNLNQEDHEDCLSNPFRTDRYAEEASTHLNPSPNPLLAESPDLLHNYINLRFPDLASSSEQNLPRVRSLNITSTEPLNIFTPEVSSEIPEVNATFEETATIKRENETQSTTVEKTGYELARSPTIYKYSQEFSSSPIPDKYSSELIESPKAHKYSPELAQSPNILIEESYAQEDADLTNPFIETLRCAFNIWKRAIIYKIKFPRDRVQSILSSPEKVNKLKGVFCKREDKKTINNPALPRTQKFLKRGRLRRTRSHDKLNEIKALAYRNGRLKLDSFFIWKNFILNKRRQRLNNYKQIANSTTDKENLRKTIQKIISDHKRTKKPSRPSIKRSTSQKDKLIGDITKLLSDIHCSDAKLQAIWHKVRNSYSRSPSARNLRLPFRCEICTKDRVQRLSREIRTVRKDMKTTISSCKFCNASK